MIEPNAFVPLANSRASLKIKNGSYQDVTVLGISRDKKVATIQYDNKNVDKISPALLESPMYPSINERFTYYEKLADLVLSKRLKSLFVSGEGGIGKGFTIQQLLEDNFMEEDKHFVMVKGHCTPYALFHTLHEHHDKVVIFDDCDSVLKELTSLNILKAVLDTYDRRIVKWLSTRGSLQSFEFHGSAIFLSNLDAESVSDAIRSRSILIDLYMTPEEKIERMEFIAPNLTCVKLPVDKRLEVLQVVDKYKYSMNNLNLRSYIKALVIYEQTSSLDLLKYSLINS